MTERELLARLEGAGYLCLHMGQSWDRTYWTVNFVRRDRFLESRGRPGTVHSPWETNEMAISMRGDTLHEALMNVVDAVCPLPPEPAPAVEYDLDAMLGLKPEKSDEMPIDLAAMLR